MRRKRKGLKFHHAARHAVDCNCGSDKFGVSYSHGAFYEARFFPQHGFF
jgi:hypothetical protein